jgi:hypothetical protein
VNETSERLRLFVIFIRLVGVGVVKVGKEGGTLFSNGLDNSTTMAHDAFRFQPLPESFVVFIGTDWSRIGIIGTLHCEVNTKELVGVGDALVRSFLLVERQVFHSCGANARDFQKVARDGAAVPLLRRTGGDLGLAGIVTWGCLEN